MYIGGAALVFRWRAKGEARRLSVRMAGHRPSVSRTPSIVRGRQGHATVLIDAIVRWLGQHYGHIVPALCCRHVEIRPLSPHLPQGRSPERPQGAAGGVA